MILIDGLFFILLTIFQEYRDVTIFSGGLQA
jgi:hypothetical protein